MAETLQTREVVPILAAQGLRVHRESLAEMSDLLGLRTREARANWIQRRWYPAEVELIAKAFHLRQDWDFPLDVVVDLVANGTQCLERIVTSLRHDLESFLGQVGAADRARASEPQQTTSAAA